MSVVVVGGGQAGLATAFYLRRAGIEHVVLDDGDGPGGAWRRTWPSLRLFSPARYSSLPGWPMPPTGDNPDAGHVIDYLAAYEERYDLDVRRPVRVDRVLHGQDTPWIVETDHGSFDADAVVLATGTWSRPHLPDHPGLASFTGRQRHSAFYAGPEEFAGQRVMVVGGANSGAQIAADLLGTAEVTWCTQEAPRYLPDDVDGRVLFTFATSRLSGDDTRVPALAGGGIVAVPPVRAARDAGDLVATPMPATFTTSGARWQDGSEVALDAVIWCTGFRAALDPLAGLEDLPWTDGTRTRLRTVIPEGARTLTRTDDGPQVEGVPGLFVVGHGDWTGAASATLIGVGQWARAVAHTLTDR